MISNNSINRHEIKKWMIETFLFFEKFAVFFVSQIENKKLPLLLKIINNRIKSTYFGGIRSVMTSL